MTFIFISFTGSFMSTEHFSWTPFFENNYIIEFTVLFCVAFTNILLGFIKVSWQKGTHLTKPYFPRKSHRKLRNDLTHPFDCHVSVGAPLRGIKHPILLFPTIRDFVSWQNFNKTIIIISHLKSLHIKNWHTSVLIWWWKVATYAQRW